MGKKIPEEKIQERELICQAHVRCSLFFGKQWTYKGLQLIKKSPYHPVTFYIQAIAKIVTGFQNGRVELVPLLDQHEPRK